MTLTPNPDHPQFIDDMHNYSPEFQALISSPDKLRELLINCSFSGSFTGWEQRKKFIAKAIHKDGSFLDIGCGNGFLIKCLQEWSPYRIIPYGIDNNPQYLAGVTDVFPGLEGKFILLDQANINSIDQYNLPQEYDFVYYSSNWKYDDPSSAETYEFIRELLNHVSSGGRLILGFYKDDATENLADLNQIEALGIKFSNSLQNPAGTNLIAWIDKA